MTDAPEPRYYTALDQSIGPYYLIELRYNKDYQSWGLLRVNLFVYKQFHA